MPAAQLKRLKASLRESGVIGPQKSKKQKKRDLKDGRGKERAVSRSSALTDIREKFNPFEVKTSSRGPKHEFATTGKSKSSVLGRPGVTKGLGEKVRREKLLVELKQRNRVGGLMDRRFGENDPGMTPEERAHERFVREKQLGRKKSSMFDLEGDDDFEDEGLTHLGNPLSFSKKGIQDDYRDSEEDSSDEDADDQAARRAGKKRRLLEDMEELTRDEATVDSEGRPKTKQEVMKEVIAKSKLHKYERQKAKEEDDDLREELDANLKDVFALMGRKSKPQPTPVSQPNPEIKINADRAALIQGKTREQADKEYDQQLRAMTQEARAQPSTRTKTEEEIASEKAQRLKELEDKRLKRMRGEESSDDDDEKIPSRGNVDDENDLYESDNEFGLGKGIATRGSRPELDVEDEDDFELDHDLIASGSEVELSSSEEDEDDESEEGFSADDLGERENATDDEAEFVKGILSAEDTGRNGLGLQDQNNKSQAQGELSYTFACPATHDEFVDMTKGIQGMELIKVIQRIRALHSPKLDSKNKAKLAVFAGILVDHIPYLVNRDQNVPFPVLDQLIRHVHSLCMVYSIEVANSFRKHMVDATENRPRNLTNADLMLLTAIGQIFSTSDHFHQVVTPAMICMGWYLGQSVPRNLGDFAKGSYICTLFLNYQRLSKRYIPEVVNYSLMALDALSPARSKKPFGQTPRRELDKVFRITGPSSNITKKMDFAATSFSSSSSSPDALELKHALVRTFVSLVSHMSELWIGSSAYIEIFSPQAAALEHLLSKPCSTKFSKDGLQHIKSTHTKLKRLLAQAQIDRRPLKLHNHRPLPIKQAIPKFEDKFNPDKKSYDPDQERVESAKLRAEHKKERKGALRELRKDANFIARENLREKKEADAEYDKKYKRLVAEIQGEEGREAKAYEREKKWRQGKK